MHQILPLGTFSTWLRTKTENNNIRFIQGETRLHPLHANTIPRSIKTSQANLLEHPHKSFFYTDSIIVLGYINNATRKFSKYVTNRVTYILNHTDAQQWRYVNTKTIRQILPQEELHRRHSTTQFGSRDQQFSLSAVWIFHTQLQQMQTPFCRKKQKFKRWKLPRCSLVFLTDSQNSPPGDHLFAQYPCYGRSCSTDNPNVQTYLLCYCTPKQKPILFKSLSRSIWLKQFELLRTR